MALNTERWHLMIPLRINFVVKQKTKFAITSQGKHILEFLFFYLKDSAACYPGLEFSRQKCDPKIVHCNLKQKLASPAKCYQVSTEFLVRLACMYSENRNIWTWGDIRAVWKYETVHLLRFCADFACQMIHKKGLEIFFEGDRKKHDLICVTSLKKFPRNWIELDQTLLVRVLPGN